MHTTLHSLICHERNQSSLCPLLCVFLFSFFFFLLFFSLLLLGGLYGFRCSYKRTKAKIDYLTCPFLLLSAVIFTSALFLVFIFRKKNGKTNLSNYSPLYIARLSISLLTKNELVEGQEIQ